MTIYDYQIRKIPEYYVPLVDQGDVLGAAVVPLQDLHIVLLDLSGLLHDVLIGIGDALRQEAAPLRIGEGIAVQLLQLPPQIGKQLRLGVDGQILIALLRKHADELPLQLRLALIAVGAGRYGRVFRHHGIFSCLGNDVEAGHDGTSYVSGRINRP